MATEFKLSYTASDINERLGRIDSLASKNELPTKLSDLVNDSDFAAKNYVQNYAQPKGDYALRSEIPTDYLTKIPEEYITEDELNSKGYLTEHQSLEDFVTNGALAQAIADVKADSANKDAVVLAEVQKGIEDAKKDASNKNAVVLAEAQKGIAAVQEEIEKVAESITVKSVNGQIGEVEITTESIGAQPFGDYALKSDIPSIKGLATETYVDSAVASLVNSAPDALNTLDELAAALGDDSNFATTVTNQIAAKLDSSALPTAIEDALAQAKASGEFDGADGKDGTNGADGISATHSWDGTTLTITSASGTSSADLKGDEGAPGYTPVRGTDYWTEADKAEIKAYIDDNMPEGTHSGGSSDSIAQVQTDYEQNDTTAVDYIKNRPFYEETKNVFNQSVTTAPNADFMNMNLYPHNQCIIDTTMIDFDNDTFDNIDIIMDVTMNDTNYSCNLKLVEGMYVIGNIYMYLEAIAASVGITVDYLLSVAPEYGILNVDSGEPFLINFELPSSESSGYTAFLTKEAGTHSFVISQNTIRKINSKFIPKVDGLPSVTTADNDKILMVVDGAWTVASIDNGDEVAY